MSQFPAEDAFFRRVTVSRLVRGPARVSWEPNPDACPPGPVTFTLEFGHTGVPGADDEWEPVPGVSGVDVIALDDPTPRIESNVEPSAHYRVVAACGGRTWRSQPVCVRNWQSRQQFLEARQAAREFLRQSRFPHAVAGYLLRRRRRGAIPDAGTAASAVDYLTGEVVDTGRLDTRGTAYEGGYYAPHPHVFVPITSGGTAVREADGRGTTDPMRRWSGLVLATPPAARLDLFAVPGADLRFVIEGVEDAALVGGTPVLLKWTMRQLPFHDVAYTIPLPAPAAPAGPCA